MRVAALPYRPDAADYFDALADLPWAVLLDSGPSDWRRGRWDFLAAEPIATLVTRGQATEIWDGQVTRSSDADPFQLLREVLAALPGPAELPFPGGAIGYFGYDLARRIERLPGHAASEGGMPEMAVGIYDWAVVLDHQAQTARLVSAGRRPMSDGAWHALQGRFRTPAPQKARQVFHSLSPARSNMDSGCYHQAFNRIRDYIREGDCYQVNLAQRFQAPCTGDPWLGYRRLRAINPAPFAAYLNLPFGQVLSSSPERFLEVRGGHVETRPIKGTRPRQSDPAADAAQAGELAACGKDRAENLMIVDLLRNDLGKVCVPGSVETSRLFEVESFANVHHLVSTVTGRLAPGLDAIDLLRAAFPGGSITGAPKLRAMEIIEELEPDRRGVYCGAIGYLGFNGDMDTNIAIRTVVITAGQAHCWAGGGIVADSEWQAEYQECLDKASPMLRLLASDSPRQE
jgi:para-aminobenzoate synthetase component 1